MISSPSRVWLAIPLGGVLQAVNVFFEAVTPQAIVALIERIDLSPIWHLQHCYDALSSSSHRGPLQYIAACGNDGEDLCMLDSPAEDIQADAEEGE